MIPQEMVSSILIVKIMCMFTTLIDVFMKEIFERLSVVFLLRLLLNYDRFARFKGI